jgi:hypothetical protein
MKGIGSTIECMEKEKLLGLMDDLTKDSTSMIKNTVSAHFSGLTGENTSDIGKTGSNMEEANIIYRTGRRRLDNGWRVKK